MTGNTNLRVKCRLVARLSPQPAAAASLNNIIDEWLKYQESRIKVTSLSTYRAYAKTHIRPVLGGLPATKLTEADVTGFLALVSGPEKDFAKKTVHLIVNILKQVLTFGQKRGITVDPALCNVRLHSGRQRTPNTLTGEEQEKLLKTLGSCNRPSDLAILLSLKTGLRIGELAGLKWGDVDFEAGFLNVRRTVGRISNDDNTTSVYIGEPKSESARRKVPLAPSLLAFLAEHRQADEIYATSGRLKPQETAGLQARFKLVLRNAGIRNINFHALRHTFATRCVEKGFDVKSLSMILGHSDVSITLNTYVHPSMENLRNMMENLE